MFFGAHDTLDAQLTNKRIVIDGPAQPQASPHLASARLLAADSDHDLSLIEIANGPFHYVPVAPAGFRPGPRLVSVGYDEMKWPITSRPATLLLTVGTWTYTRQKPWHGRSGGGLIDVDAHCLIGVVNGYEMSGQERGIYVSHASILGFLAQNQGPMTNAPRGPPRLIVEPRPSPPAPWCPGGT